MNLRFPESEIGYWSNLYTERQREENRMREQHLINLTCDVMQRDYLTQQELHKIARWKSRNVICRTVIDAIFSIPTDKRQAADTPQKW